MVKHSFQENPFFFPSQLSLDTSFESVGKDYYQSPQFTGVKIKAERLSNLLKVT